MHDARVRSRSVASDTVESFILKLLVYAGGFLASALIARGLGPEGRGVYYLPVVSAATVAAMATVGVEQANVYLFGTRGISIARLWAQGGLVAAALGVCGSLVLIAAPSVFPGTFAQSPAALWWLAAAGLPLTLHGLFAAGLMTLNGEVTWQFRVGVVNAIAQTSLLAVLYWLDLFDTRSVLAASLCSTVLTWILMVPRVPREAGWLRWDAALLRETLRHSLVLHAGMVLLFLHLRADMFMLTGMVGAAALGIYSLSVTLAETALLVTDSVAVAVLPRQMTNSLQESAITSLRAARMNLLLSSGVITAWAIAGLPLIRFVFGDAFAAAYLPLLALLPGMAFMGMQRVCGAPVIRAGMPHRVVAINALSLALNVVLNLWWIPAWGGTGAALASSCSYGVGALLFLKWTAGMAGSAFPRALVPTSDDAETAWRGLSAALAAGRSAIRQ
jgi:O-antigen/teichoic acid export membrane protein